MQVDIMRIVIEVSRCVHDFNIQGIADSPIDVTCNLNNDDGSSTGSGDGGETGGIGDYIPKIQLAVGGVGSLFLMC